MSTHNHLTVVVRTKTTGGSGGQPAFTGLLRGRGGGGGIAASQTNPKENGVAFGEAVFTFLQTTRKCFFSFNFHKFNIKTRLAFQSCCNEAEKEV